MFWHRVLHHTQDIKFNCLLKGIHTTCPYCCLEWLIWVAFCFRFVRFVFYPKYTQVNRFLWMQWFLDQDIFPLMIKVYLPYICACRSPLFHLLLLSPQGFLVLLSLLTFSGSLHIINTASYCTLGRTKELAKEWESNWSFHTLTCQFVSVPFSCFEKEWHPNSGSQ